MYFFVNIKGILRKTSNELQQHVIVHSAQFPHKYPTALTHYPRPRVTDKRIPDANVQHWSISIFPLTSLIGDRAAPWPNRDSCCLFPRQSQNISHRHGPIVVYSLPGGVECHESQTMLVVSRVWSIRTKSYLVVTMSYPLWDWSIVK